MAGIEVTCAARIHVMEAYHSRAELPSLSPDHQSALLMISRFIQSSVVHLPPPGSGIVQLLTPSPLQ